MKEAINNYVQKRCCLVLEETDLIKVLDVLDSRRLSKNITVEKGDKDKWYIMFRATKRAWDSLIADLEVNCMTDILIPTKDNFGDVFYQKI